MSRTITALAFACIAGAAAPALADTHLPPFDFSDSFYLANGVNPATLVGRPTGNGVTSVIDNRENGPNFNNIRMLEQSAAYDHSGHPIFFYVTGLPRLASFTTAAALQTAEAYNVYEFPRAANALGAVFPKRQDLVADLRNGYFSHDPLGVWKINIVRYTPAATGTANGRRALDELAARNGRDLDGTPLIRRIGEVEDLVDDGYATIFTPPQDGSVGFRWFFCPVLEDPRNGAIAPDAELTVTGRGVLAAAQEFINLFECLQTTGDDNCGGGGGPRSDFDGNGQVAVQDIYDFLAAWNSGDARTDFSGNASVDVQDIYDFLSEWSAAT